MPDDSHEKKKSNTISLPLAVTVLAGIASVFLTLFIDIKSTQSLIESRYEERTVKADAWLKRMDDEQKRARNTRSDLRELIAKISEQVSGQHIVDAEVLLSVKAIHRMDAELSAVHRELDTLSGVVKEHIDLRGHGRFHYPQHWPEPMPGP